MLWVGFTDWMFLLSPNQQCQRTEENAKHYCPNRWPGLILSYPPPPADRRDIAPFMPVPEHIEFVTALKLSIYPSYSSDWLWPRNGQAIIFLQLWFLSSSFFFFPRLFSASTRGVALVRI